MTQTHQNESEGLGVASLILGILSVTILGVLTGIPAIITGFMGLKNPASKGMSIAGIIMGGVSVLFTLLVAGFFVLLFVLGLGSDPEPYNPTDPPSYTLPVEPDSNYQQQRT